jgi:hypothetical protein
MKSPTIEAKQTISMYIVHSTLYNNEQVFLKRPQTFYGNEKLYPFSAEKFSFIPFCAEIFANFFFLGKKPQKILQDFYLSSLYLHILVLVALLVRRRIAAIELNVESQTKQKKSFLAATI